MYALVKCINLTSSLATSPSLVTTGIDFKHTQTTPNPNIPPPVIPIVDSSKIRIKEDIGEGNFGRVFLAEICDSGNCSIIATSSSSGATPRPCKKPCQMSNVMQCLKSWKMPCKMANGLGVPPGCPANLTTTTSTRGRRSLTVHYSNCCAVNVGQYVALKQLKFVSDEKLHELEAEAETLVTLTHPHIVTFYGVTVVHESLALAFEYMDLGDLVTYLREHNPELTDDPNSVLQQKDLLKISLQVTSAVEYIAQKNLVHRDIAARNCLVATGLLVKLSDFGMSRSLYTSDYYKIDQTTAVPLRWLPPECILYRKFNTESDIWSLGVLFWEIFSYGQVPWSIYSNSEVMAILKCGQLLERPERCPIEIYRHLILRCWEARPQDRITATQAKAVLEECLECTSMYVNVLDIISSQNSPTSKSAPASPTYENDTITFDESERRSFGTPDSLPQKEMAQNCRSKNVLFSLERDEVVI